MNTPGSSPIWPRKTTARLVASIGENGLLEPVAVWRGEVIDGRHRLRACAEAGVEPHFSHLDAATDPLEYVLARNEARRHLDTSQRALIAYELSRESRPGGDRRSDDYQRNADHSANLPNGLTQEQAAARLEVSPRLVRDTGRIMAADRPAAPALRRAIRARRVKISDAKRALEQPAEVQAAALARLASGAAKTLGRAVSQVNSERAEAAATAAVAANLLAAAGRNHHPAPGGAGRPDLSWWQRPAWTAAAPIRPTGAESLPLLADLAAFAAHALQPSGALLVLSGMEQLPETLEQLKHPDLHWVAEFDYRDNGTTTWSRPPHRTRLRRKSLLIYGKRGFRLPPGDDVIELPPPEPGAAARRQGQLNNAGLELILARFARPGQVLCDPLMLSQASAALAARKLGCPFIGADREATSIARGRRHLEEGEVDPAAA